MSQGHWSKRVVGKYVLAQLPALVVLASILVLVRRWVDLSWWFVCGIVALWMIKDVALFPFVWRSYAGTDQPRNTHLMLGARGTVEDPLAPAGYVRVHGELWRAEVIEGSPSIGRGQGVRVRGTRRLTLLVEPDQKNEGEPVCKKMEQKE
ncbi:MAG: hypothetical protein GTN74_16800 [Proteobacteria bacterium]|nr:hypothetical protein [Pseudomonadota bacterium]NIS72413.1 hypothetical protein [Pseudomonadota bacterium]